MESGPLCLSLHKPISARDAARMLPNDVIRASENAKHGHLYGHQSNHPGANQASLKTARQFTQENWRSRSEPLDGNVPGRPQRQTLSLQTSPQSQLMRGKVEGSSAMKRETLLDKEEIDQSHVDELKNDYNYVLTLPSSPGSDGQTAGIPASPMQVPLRYPKSIPYSISSDEEDEPEDLSISSASQNNQPENLTVCKPQPSHAGLAAKDQNAVKYDSNANAVTVPLAQLNGQLIAPAQIPIPQNLIFHDPRTVVGQPPLMHMTSKSLAQPVSQGSIMQTSAANQRSMLLTNQPPPPALQLVNIPGPPPILMRPAMVSPTSSSQILVPVNSVGPVNNQQPSLSVKGNTSDDNQSQDSPGRKKRKKMEDTTVFRDPPEQSLPFNGPNKYRFYCDVCDTGFTRRYTFNRHKCKGRVEKHYCQLCDKAYLSKYKLKDHILVKHEGQTVSCPECGKRFSSRSSMEMHKKQQHEGQYSIFCKICGKGFNHTGHYYGHMNKHTNTKPFWCQQCGKRFYGSSYLHNHKQVCRGNNDLNYSCTICDRKFKCELYLKKHMKIHDSTPIIANPNVAKPTDEDLTKAGVQVAEIMDQSNSNMSNGDSYQNMSMPIFPNGPDFSDSSSNSALMIDESLKGDNRESILQEEGTDVPVA